MSLPPKIVTIAEFVVAFDLVLAAERRPVDVGLVAALLLHDERSHARAFGDDVVDRERLLEVEPGVDLLEQERPVVVVDGGERGVDPGVGRPDHRPAPHRDHVEQALGVVEEREHPIVTVVVVSRGTTRWMPFEYTMRCSVDRPHTGSSSSTNGPAALTIVRADVVELLARVDVAELRDPAMPRRVDTLGRDQLDIVGDRCARPRSPNGRTRTRTGSRCR